MTRANDAACLFACMEPPWNWPDRPGRRYSRSRQAVNATPIRIFHGEADDYVPIAPCREYAARLTVAGKDVKVIGYPEAFHAFDAIYLPVTRLPNAQKIVRYNAAAHAAAIRDVRAFLKESFALK